MKYRNSGVYLFIVAAALVFLAFGCRSEKGNLKGLKMVKLETTKGAIVI